MIKIQGIGCPFDISHSSCSTLTPKNFVWSSEQQKIKIFLDSEILKKGIKTGYDENKYAWMCESRAIGSAVEVRKQLIKNHKKILKHYKYLFTCEKELCKLDSRIKWTYSSSNLPWCFGRNYNTYVPEKTKLVSMLCSPKNYTTGHLHRLKIAFELKDKLDLFGGAHGSIRPGEGSGAHRDKSSAIDPYMFSVVFENDFYSGYFTEKITDCFARGTIPVYCGDPDICEHFDCDGIIPYKDGILSTLTQDLYYSKTNAIKNNMEKVFKMEMSEDYFVSRYILNKGLT